MTFHLHYILEKHKLLDDTIIIILSDHGDNIGDHGLMFHYFSLYDTLIKIPLFVKYPAGHYIKGRVTEIVQNTDILPTILDLNGISEVTNHIDGKSFEGGGLPVERRRLL